MSQSHTELAALLPCPFCGHDLYTRRSAYNPKAHCITEGCKGAQLPVLNLDQPDDIAAWNTRAAALESPERVQGEAVKEKTYGRRDEFRPAVHGGVSVGVYANNAVACGGVSSLTDSLWNSIEVMSVNAELGLTMDQLVRLSRAIISATPPTAPDQDAQGVSAILDALRVGRVACEWAEKTAEVQQIAAAMEIAKSMLSATPSPQAEKQPLSDEQIEEVYRDVWSTVVHAKRLSAFARAIERAHGIVTKEST